MCHYMKPLITVVALLTLMLSTTAKGQISYAYTELKRTQYDSCSKTNYLVSNSQIKKQSGKLTVPIAGKPSEVFKDDNSDENFEEYKYLGDIKWTKLALIKRTDYNSEKFYLLNWATGSIDTLVGQPVFAQNIKDFACLNNPKTDEKQQIQVCEIKNGSVKTRVYIIGKADTFFEDIACINRNSILTKDTKGKHWKLNFKTGDE